MHFPSPGSRRSWWSSGITGALLIGILAVNTGCNRDSIAVYDAPRDPAPAPVSPHGGDSHGFADQMPALPSLRWTSLPEGWDSLGAAGMRVANFSVAGTSGRAELAVIPLPGMGGDDLDLVNLWRNQLSLSPIDASALASHTAETRVGDQQVKIFDIVGKESSDSAAAGKQILVAALRRDGFTWFFKLAGDAGTVDANRDALKGFLGDVEFLPPEASARVATPSSPPRTTPSGPPATPNWQPPAEWTAVDAPAMVMNKWSVAQGGASADITVTVFPGEAGGLAANLNRWRGQVGLQPASEAELNSQVKEIDVLGGTAQVAEFAGTSPESGDPAVLMAAIVRRDGFSWFYKILGSPEAVEAQRDVFLRFVQSVQYRPRS